MTYSPGSPGYPPGQQPSGQFPAPTQQFASASEGSGGPSKLPMYLAAAVAALGIAVWLSSLGPYLTAGIGTEVYTPIPLYLGITAAILAGLLAGVALLPKQPDTNGVAAALSVLGFLLVMALVITVPSGVTIDWGLYLIIAFSAIQAIVAVAVVLFDSGVLSPPVARPKYDPQQYGQYGAPGAYYGQPQPGQPQPGQQRPGYPAQYGGYPGGPSTGGFSAMGPQGGTPTPPTGFPAFGQPQPSAAPTTQVPAQPQQQPPQPQQQQPPQQPAPPSPSAPQSDQTPS